MSDHGITLAEQFEDFREHPYGKPPTLGVDTSELVDALLGVVHSPPPARVKVKPLGPAVWQEGGYIRSKQGWLVTCTEHGTLFSWGARYLSNVITQVARPHLKEKHS